MFKKLLILLLMFYLLALFQTSFFTYFNIANQIPNLVLVVLFLIIFLERKITDAFPVEVVLAGFFLDIFSRRPLGVSIVILFLAGLCLEGILKTIKKQNVFVFLVLFLAFIFSYEIALAAFDYLILKPDSFAFNQFTLIRIFYSFLFFLIAYPICLVKPLKILKTRR